ncbi:MAG: SPOR domain-containing protein [Spirochaetia bacterium]
MKRWIRLALLLVPLLASAASFWDGNAALQRGDATFESGMYAASNSFPEETQIAIVNLDTGKSATATVTKRIDGQSDILVLLSPMTASALGISQGTLARVRVTIATRQNASSTTPPDDQTYSLDPDLNPGAAYGEVAQGSSAAASQAATSEESTAVAAAPSPTEETQAQAAPEETTPGAAPQTEQQPAEQQPASTPEVQAQSAQAVAQQDAAAQEAANAAIIAAAEARTPQKQVFQPPREDEKFAYQKPAETPQTAPTEPTATQPIEAAPPQITSVTGEPGVAPGPAQPADLQLAEAVAPEESQPQEIVSAGSALPAPAETGTAVALAMPEPAPEEQTPAAQEPMQTEVTGPETIPPASSGAPVLALLPPEEPAPAQPAAPQQASAQQTSTQQVAAQQPAGTSKPQTPAPAAASAGSTASVQTVASLPRSGKLATYYLQLGAFATEKVAQDLAASLIPIYPTLVLAPSGMGTRVFKVVIGPLNGAETGTLLTWFRYRGFPDAFVKQE